MPIPNGGLITETNRQYYAGAQQFTIGATSVGQTFTSTFDTNLVFGSSDPASNDYNLNNFKVFTDVLFLDTLILVSFSVNSISVSLNSSKYSLNSLINFLSIFIFKHLL